MVLQGNHLGKRGGREEEDQPHPPLLRLGGRGGASGQLAKVAGGGDTRRLPFPLQYVRSPPQRMSYFLGRLCFVSGDRGIKQGGRYCTSCCSGGRTSSSWGEYPPPPPKVSPCHGIVGASLPPQGGEARKTKRQGGGRGVGGGG